MQNTNSITGYVNFDKGKKNHVLYIAASSLDWTTHATIQWTDVKQGTHTV